MSFEEFQSSLKNSSPPETLTATLEALWFDGKNDWESAHNIAQDINTAEGSWIHAYLHRKEGDLGNAAYWYSRAGKPMPKLPLEEEWKSIVREILN